MTQHFITVNGIRLHYVEEGQGELVILLHGFPEFWYGWRKQIPVLSKKYRVVAPDMRGYNLSDKPKGIQNYKIEILASDIAALVKALGEEQAIIAGHDWGGAVAWAVATLHPQVVKKLAVLNICHPSEMKKALMGFNLAQWKKSYYIFLFQLPRLPERFIGKDLKGFFTKAFTTFLPKGKASTITSEEIAKYVEAYSQPGMLTAAINYYRATFRQLGSMHISGKLTMPVLMIWGEQDHALGKELTYNTKNYCTDLELIYDPTSGHFIQHDNPELVNGKLLEFFEK
jgi:pimeloyl-ACP methyl ester carboxylesterase